MARCPREGQLSWLTARLLGLAIAALLIASCDGGESEPDVIVLPTMRSLDGAGATAVSSVREEPTVDPESTSTPEVGGQVTVGPDSEPPTPTPNQGQVDATVPVPPTETEAWCCFSATRYGESYEGEPLGCPGYTLPAGRADRLYHSADTQILAASPAFYRTWECGKYLQVTNLRNGQQLEVVRMDSCPGCGDYQIDLSEAGYAWLCGVDHYSMCREAPSGLTIVACKPEGCQ